MTLMRKSDKKERALLVGVIYRDNTKDVVFEHLEELSLLADTAGAETIETITQKIQRINPAFYIGKGKAEQIVQQAKELKIDVIISLVQLKY